MLSDEDRDHDQHDHGYGNDPNELHPTRCASVRVGELVSHLCVVGTVLLREPWQPRISCARIGLVTVAEQQFRPDRSFEASERLEVVRPRTWAPELQP